MTIDIRPPRPEELPQLCHLFVEAFGEPEFAGDFFRSGFSPSRCLVAVEGKVLGMVHWFDCTLGEKRLAYLYAIAVRKDCRGKGIGSRLISFSTAYLQNYDGILLVPAEESLFSYYEKFGFSPCSTISECRVEAGKPVPLREISTGELTALRRKYLPPGGIRQEGPMLDLLGCFAKCYASSNALAIVSGGDVLEFLGEPQELPSVLAALGLGAAMVRMPGIGRVLAMGLGLEENLYFGLPLD